MKNTSFFTSWPTASLPKPNSYISIYECADIELIFTGASYSTRDDRDTLVPPNRVKNRKKNEKMCVCVCVSRLPI